MAWNNEKTRPGGQKPDLAEANSQAIPVLSEIEVAAGCANEGRTCGESDAQLTRGRSALVPLRRNVSELSVERLRELLIYDPETGKFAWRKRTGPMCKLGKPAGCVKQGYRRIAIDGRSYTASHLAWLYHYGEAPAAIVDHKNGDKDDNRIENLRSATPSENCRNQKRNVRNTTGLKGASRFNNKYQRAKFRSSIRANGKRIFLGLFHTAEEAHEAYCKAAAKLHGEFACTK